MSDDEDVYVFGRRKQLTNEDHRIFCNVLNLVVKNGTYSDDDISKIETACLSAASIVEQEKKLSNIFISGLDNVVLLESLPVTIVSTVFSFFSKVALRCHLLECDFPLSVLRQEISKFFNSRTVYVRHRACLLVSELLDVRSTEMMAQDETLSQSQGDPFIPPCLLKEWGVSLSHRRLDKEPVVRAAALSCLSLFPVTSFVDLNTNIVETKQLINQSLFDENILVRQAAIRLVSLTCSEDIDMCFTFVEKESSPTVRYSLLERLITMVHFSSYTHNQRLKLVDCLLSDKDGLIQTLVGKRLVPKWVKDNNQMGTTSDRFTYPTILINFFDLDKNEEKLSRLVTLGIYQMMETSIGSKTNGVAFLDYLLEFSEDTRHSHGILDRAFVLNIPKSNLDPKLLVSSLFSHRCLVELMYSLYRNPSKIADKDLIMNRLLPNMLACANILNELFFSTDLTLNDKQKEFCVVQMSRIMKCIDNGCDIGRAAWKESLCSIVCAKQTTLSNEIIEFCIHDVLSQLAFDDIEEFCDNICYFILEYFPTDVTTDVVDLSDDRLRQLSTMLHSLLHHAAVTTVTPIMRNSFEKLIEILTVSPLVELRKMGCRLLGLGCCLEDTVMKLHSHKLRHSIELDLPEVKSVAIVAISDIVLRKKFTETSVALFPEASKTSEDSVERFSRLLERSLAGCDINILDGFVFNCLKIMFVSGISWPKLFSIALIRTFESGKPAENSEVLSVLEDFVEVLKETGMSGSMRLTAALFQVLEDIDYQHLSTKGVQAMATFVAETLNNFNLTNAVVSPIVVLIMGLLDWMERKPHNVSTEFICYNIIQNISTNTIDSVHLETISTKCRSVVLTLYATRTCSEKMLTNMERFSNCLERISKRKVNGANGTVKLGKRTIKTEDSEDDSDDFIYSERVSTEIHAPSKRPKRTCPSVSYMQVKEEPMDGIMDVVLIDDMDDDLFPPIKNKECNTTNQVVEMVTLSSSPGYESASSEDVFDGM